MALIANLADTATLLLLLRYLNIMAKESLTPAMQQFWDLKKTVPDALLFYRMGDFYELFGDDAVQASKILDITLTSRDKSQENPLPMAGFPWHSAQGYIQTLLNSGRKVAIAEQLNKDGKIAAGKDIVKRDIVRVLTPGLHFESTGNEEHFLACGFKSPTQNTWHLACLDLGTGEFGFDEFDTESEFCSALGTAPIRHFLRVGGKNVSEAVSKILRERSSLLVEDLPSNFIHSTAAETQLKEHFGWSTLSAYVTRSETVFALGVILTFALKSQRTERLPHLKAPRPLRTQQSLTLGPATAQHLNLIGTQDQQASIFDLMNRTQTAAGARKLKRWILNPLKDLALIQGRQTALAVLSASRPAERLIEIQKSVYDLERICGRLQSGLCNPRDLLALSKSILVLRPTLAELQTIVQDSQTPSSLIENLAHHLKESDAALTEIADTLSEAWNPEPPISAKEGGIFKMGVLPELDRWIQLSENGERALIEMEERERVATGITNLKIKYSRVFGYSIEVTTSHLSRVPAHYIRKQTMTGAERYITEELKKFEDELLQASERRKAIEFKLFEEWVQNLQKLIPQMMSAAEVLSEIDVLLSLSKWVGLPGWIFPTLDSSQTLELHRSRHPLLDSPQFVSNSIQINANLVLITGPNMGGKSTVMRQIAVAVVLGQMGAPIPAESAHWGIVSSIYTRIGAHDAITRGQSTFMVEMAELSHILSRADSRSLILLDEIGRGTSTYDGMSVAWATLEWIATQLKARTLFATHYHELTRLESEVPGVKNAHMAVEEDNHGDLRFLYQLKPGPTSDSYGIQVAKLAGLPLPVVERAWQVLKRLEGGTEVRPMKIRLSPNEKLKSTDQLNLI